MKRTHALGFNDSNEVEKVVWLGLQKKKKTYISKE